MKLTDGSTLTLLDFDAALGTVIKGQFSTQLRDLMADVERRAAKHALSAPEKGAKAVLDQRDCMIPHFLVYFYSPENRSDTGWLSAR